MSSAKVQPFCLSLDALIYVYKGATKGHKTFKQ